MTKLSVNINKIATLRNSRGGNTPDVIQAAKAIEQYGAEGITVHPRPDERHIRYHDVYELKKIVTTELNIEGNPSEKKFVDLVLSVQPTQVTLVPDTLSQLTSNHGWDTQFHLSFLQDTVALFKNAGIRVSIFLDPNETMVEFAAKTGTDRIELYTESYANRYVQDKEQSIKPYVQAALLAKKLGLGVNAGHDLSTVNLRYFIETIPWIDEVSIGHALISDALYWGLEATVRCYLEQLHPATMV